MAIYIDREDLPDVENIPASVLEYIIKKHTTALTRYEKLYRYYTAQNITESDDEDVVSMVVSYPKYIVDVILGFYLGDPVKYDADEEEQDDSLTPGAFEATVKNGKVIRHEWKEPEIDISPVVAAYDEQSIAECDSRVGRDVGLYGEAYELEYASDDAVPVPKTTICDPRTSIMVRDTTVEHHKLFFMTYEKRERVGGGQYYNAFIYTDQTVKQYQSEGSSLNTFRFVPGTEQPHFFGEVPAVEYQNNFDRLGDFETVTSLIDALNTLMSDRCTDKRKFIDAILAVYGMGVDDKDKDDLKKYKMLDNLPTEARIEYVQKTFDESSVHILAEDLIREIHKQTMTVDMTDEQFAGNSSGQALKLKLLTMNMLVKNKIRNMEKGLRKRFEMYNHWLGVQGIMPIMSKQAVTPVFTVSMPINETEVVSIVKQLDGIVDKKTLLSLLWFVRDPEAVLEKVQEEKAESQRQYLDTFGITANRRENIGTEDGEEGREDE